MGWKSNVTNLCHLKPCTNFDIQPYSSWKKKRVIISRSTQQKLQFLDMFGHRKNMKKQPPFSPSKLNRQSLRMAWVKTASSQLSVDTGASKSAFTVSNHSRGSGAFLEKGSYMELISQAIPQFLYLDSVRHNLDEMFWCYDIADIQFGCQKAWKNSSWCTFVNVLSRTHWRGERLYNECSVARIFY